MSELDNEFLHSFSSEAYPEHVTPQFLVQNSLVLTPRILYQVLREAQQHLQNHPGPNLSFRQLWAPEWVGWWADGFESIMQSHPSDELLFPCSRVVTLDAVAQTVQRYNVDGPSGLILMGGGEGTPGHRHAADWVIEHSAIPVLALGPREWVRRKTRIDYFLPPEIIISIWSYYENESLSPKKPWGVITYLPDNLDNQPDNQFFEGLVAQMNIDLCFASQDDPHQALKRARGNDSPVTLIPESNIPRTTDMVHKLMPDPFDEN